MKRKIENKIVVTFNFDRDFSKDSMEWLEVDLCDKLGIPFQSWDGGDAQSLAGFFDEEQITWRDKVKKVLSLKSKGKKFKVTSVFL